MPKPLFEQLGQFLAEIEAVKTAAAGTKRAEANTEPGSIGGASAHPTADAEDNTMAAKEGPRSAENTADVKKDVGAASVDDTSEGMPDQVSLETVWFEDLGDGTTRLHAQSLCDSFESRDGWLASGMEVGVNDGYAAIDRLLESGEL